MAFALFVRGFLGVLLARLTGLETGACAVCWTNHLAHCLPVSTAAATVS